MIYSFVFLSHVHHFVSLVSDLLCYPFLQLLLIHSQTLYCELISGYSLL